MGIRAFRAWRRFSRQEEGSSTIEAVIWLPVFFGITILVADASMLFNSQAQMLRIVQDANRAYSTGQLLDTTDVESYITSRVAGITNRATIASSVDTALVPAGVITTSLAIPADDLDAIGIIAGLTGFDVSVAAQHYVEF